MTALLKLFDWVPGWLYAATLAAVLALLGISTVRHTKTSEALHKERGQWAQMTAQAEREARAQSEKNRAIEQELIDAQETHAVEVAAIRSELDAARDRARVESGRVRNAARAYAQRASAQCADATATELRASAADALDVLADVFSRAEQRATELAGQADGSRIAGLACEAHYDRVRAVISKH